MAQNPQHQQRFLRFLGQRSVTTGTILPNIEPFRAGVPTTASLVFAIIDRNGQILRDDSTIVYLSLVGQNNSNSWTNPSEYFVLSDSCVTQLDIFLGWRTSCKQSPIPLRIRGGIAEFVGLRLSGKVRNNAIFLCTSATAQATAITVSLIGGKASWLSPELSKTGALSVPGRYYDDLFPIMGTTASLWGTTSTIEVGKPIILGQNSNDHQYLTLKAIDRWHNTATVSTTVTIVVGGGTPPTNQLFTPLLGNQENTDPVTGRVEFRNFQILGSTSNGIVLFFTVNDYFGPFIFDIPRTGTGLSDLNGYTEKKQTARIQSSPLIPSVWDINLVPGPAATIAPVIMADIYSTPLPPGSYFTHFIDRIPSRFTVGQSNAHDPRTWFFLQAVDQFGNRVDRGPNAYNGGLATIRLAAPEEGLPRSTTSTFQFSPSNDPYTKANSQRYAATGTSAVAVNGLFTFNNFMPLGPPSRSTTDTVVLTFEAQGLSGATEQRFSLPLWNLLFRPLPPITTATTTFVQPTSVAHIRQKNSITIFPNPASELLYINFAPESSSILYLRVEDLLGRTVLEREEYGKQGISTLDIHSLQQGAYILHLRSGILYSTARFLVVR